MIKMLKNSHDTYNCKETKSVTPIISSPEYQVPMVSYCDLSMSVVHPAVPTIALKAYSSYIPGPFDSKLGRKHQGDL